jgi:hypothetical protein
MKRRSLAQPAITSVRMVAVAMINFCMLFSPLRNHNRCRPRNDSREQRNSNFAATDGSNCPRQFFYADALEIVLLVAYCFSKEHGGRLCVDCSPPAALQPYCRRQPRSRRSRPLRLRVGHELSVLCALRAQRRCFPTCHPCAAMCFSAISVGSSSSGVANVSLKRFMNPK